MVWVMTGRLSAHARTRVLSMTSDSHPLVLSPNFTFNGLRSYMGGMEVQIQSLLNSVVDGDSCSASRPGLMTPGREVMLGGLKFLENRTSLAPTGIQTPYVPARGQFTVLY